MPFFPDASALPDYYQMQRSEPDANTVQYVAAALELSSDMVDPTRDFVVFGDIVTLPATLTAPGRNVTIVARSILGTGCTIDVSAPPVTATFAPGNKPPPVTQGIAGTGGGPGDSGGNAGRITIVAETISVPLTLRANGANGGRGQDGGDGGPGAPGANGADAVLTNNDMEVATDATAGGPGQNGLQGGAAGPSGKGGNGGKVVVASCTADVAITATATNGTAGPPATPGIGGLTGGAGGIGGRHAMRASVPGNKWASLYLTLDDNSRAPSGANGSAGVPGTQPAPAQDGTAGSTAQNQILQYGDFLTVFPNSLPQVELMISVAQIAYMNANYDFASELLTWLWQTTPQDDSLAAKLANFDQWSAVNAKAAALLGQLVLRLDFFGNPVNHVPVVSLATFQEALTGMLTLAGEIEASYQNYQQQDQDQQAQQATLQQALEKSNELLANQEQAVEQALQEQASLLADIEGLTTSLAAQQKIMLAADDNFQAAAKKAASACSFNDIITMVTSVISIGVDGFNAISAIKEIKSLADGAAKAADVIKQIETATKSISDIQGKCNTISKLNTQDTPDAGKVAVNSDDFDNAIKPFMDLPEAQNFKTQMDDYLSIIQSRNNKLLKYNGTTQQIAHLQASKAHQQAAQAQLQSNLSNAVDPTLSPMRTFMQTLYTHTMANLLRNVYAENQAFSYWSLQHQPFASAGMNVAQMASYHNQISQEILDLLNASSTPYQPFHDSKVIIEGSDRPQQFQTFLSTGQLSFAIPLEHDAFRDLAHVLAENFTVALPNATTQSGTLYLELTHCGHSLFHREDGTVIDFGHEPRIIPFSFNLKTGEILVGGNLGGDNQQFIGLSPFTVWTLSLGKDNPGLDVSKVTQCQITFCGRCLPFTNAAVASGTA